MTTRARGPRTLIGLLAALSLLVAFSMPTFGASVTPEFVPDTANKECDEFQGAGQSWTTLKIDPNPNGAGPFVYTSGPLTVTITNAVGDKSFDWSSNIGIDAVYVKAGAGGSYLYRYDPPSEATSDTNLQSPGDSGNGISHISFCYDLGDPTPTPSQSEEETPTPSEDETPSPAPSESEQPEEETASPTPTPREDTQGGTPAPSQGELPDTATGLLGGTPATLLTLALMVALAGTVYTRLARER